MKTCTLLAFAALPLIISCNAQKTKTPAVSSRKNTPAAITEITLAEGQNIFLKTQQMNLTFKEIITDSRCPKGVNCIWQGVAVARLRFMSVTSRPWDFELATVENPAKGYNGSVSAEGYRYTLIKVEPKPADNIDLKGKYRITLQVEKLPAAGQSEPTKKSLPPITQPAPSLK